MEISAGSGKVSGGSSGKLRVKFKASKFDLQLKKIVYKMEEEARAVKAFVVGKFFETVIEATPIKTGSLRLNWLIGVGEKSRDDNVMFKFGEAFGTSAAQYYRKTTDGRRITSPIFKPAFVEEKEIVVLRDALDKIKSAPVGAPVFISNTTQENNPYVINAERLGWKVRGPYHMAQYAKGVAEMALKSYLSRSKLGQKLGPDFSPNISRIMNSFSVGIRVR